MRTSVRYPQVALAVWLLGQGALVAQSAPLQAEDVSTGEEPVAVALRFARAFEKKDFATMRSLLTENATIVRTALSRTAAPQIQRSSASAWADEAERNHAFLRDLRLDVLAAMESRLDQGAVVNLRYRFTGKAGKTPFVSDGIDTYLLIAVQGRWRILQYSYLERLELFPGVQGSPTSRQSPGGER